MKEEKKPEIVFAPGCFDSFEGTQEELDELMKEIQEMFLTKTKDEILAMSTPLDEVDFDELPDRLKQSLLDGDLEDLGDLDGMNVKRNLQ